ncbi:MAG: hypothetical protein JWN01_361 [Patescibacteria group bacterium]|nr:hypothetical protein [Patescibacteria group bacterium]
MSLTVEDFERIDTIVTNAVGHATKGLATKNELHDAVRSLATKDELNRVESRLTTLATKDDLDRMESRLVTSINLVEWDTLDRLDGHEKRIVHLEQVVAR